MLQIVSDVNSMRSKRSRVRVYVRRIDMCDVFLLMRFKGQFWIETCFLLLLFFFFLQWLLEKFFGISLVHTFMLYTEYVMTMILIKQKFCNIREDFTSLFSLSLSFNYLVPISAGIARVVKVKLARAQGVHDDVEDTELTGG